ncbi:MAG: LacI family transcriptional regulator [Clostridioides sp.]|nr:LacI family transcriptional regulator [Clostridioides sp.]
MKKTITIKDVAKLAGVSISTVSRVINDSKPVTDEIKERVLEVIKETGYIPNPLARSLVTKKSQLIGVVVPEVSDTFVNEILNGIEEVAKMYDYDILLSNTYSDKEQELKSLNLLRAKQVEGIVMISWILDEKHVEFIQNSGLPATYISKTARDFDIYTVSTSNEAATFDMTDHLIGKGHKKIAFIMTSKHETILEMERLAGYKDALAKNNIEYDPSLIKYGETHYESGYENMKELLDAGIIPEAAFVTGDEAAIGAINAIFDAGYRVPEDISVAGFNDVKIAQMYRPKLTTVSQPLYDMGAVAMRMVIKLIDGEKIEEKKAELPYKIVDRESVIDRK